MSKIRLEILDTERVNLLTKLSEFKNVGYLSDGTALALQIGHRRSVDFDIFVDKPIDNNLKLRINAVLPSAQYTSNTSDRISLSTVNNISVTFLWYYFPRINGLVNTEYLPLASVQDIAADKAMTIGRRAAWRDYVDMYFLLKDVMSLDQVIESGEKKFKTEFVIVQFLQQLTYFEDVAVVPIDYIKASPTAAEIKDFLQTEVRHYAENLS